MFEWLDELAGIGVVGVAAFALAICAVKHRSEPDEQEEMQAIDESKRNQFSQQVRSV